MAKHLERDLDRLKKKILTMGSMVEEATDRAISALIRRRHDMASAVLNGDDAIDELENEIEDSVLKLLALHQPVATDLRFVVMVLKINHDLERMGDLAANMAERTQDLLALDPLPTEVPIVTMGKRVRNMVRQSLDAVVRLDTDLARSVCAADDEIDQLHRQMFATLIATMKENPNAVDAAVGVLSLSRYLERIADHTTNIAEDLVFLVEGEVIRHGKVSHLD